MKWINLILSLLIIIILFSFVIFLINNFKKDNVNRIKYSRRFENIIIDNYLQELANQGYEIIKYKMKNITQQIFDKEIGHQKIKENIINKYTFYAIYYKTIIDDKECIFKNKIECESFIEEIYKYTDNKTEYLISVMPINNESSEEDIDNIIEEKKEIKRKQEEEEAKKEKLLMSIGSLSDYQQYAHDLCINEYGWTEYDFACLVELWNKESGWDPNSHNNSSGAHGIPQALPASKMASEGDDYYTSGYTQIRWGLKYIVGRYNSPATAWDYFQSNGWY